MKCSELIQLLQRVAAEHGDIEVGCANHEYGNSHVAQFLVVESNREKELNADYQDEAELGKKFLEVP